MADYDDEDSFNQAVEDEEGNMSDSFNHADDGAEQDEDYDQYQEEHDNNATTSSSFTSNGASSNTSSSSAAASSSSSKSSQLAFEVDAKQVSLLNFIL